MRSNHFSFVRCVIIILMVFVITLMIYKKYINTQQAYFKMLNVDNNVNCEPNDRNPVQRPKELPTIPSSSATTTTTLIATTLTATATTTISNPIMSTSVMGKSPQITTANQTFSQATSITQTQTSMQHIFNTTVIPNASTSGAVATRNVSTRNENTAVTANNSAAKYFTLKFAGACAGRISNKIFEFVSAYGIARTLNRIPYVDLNVEFECAKLALQELSDFFPKLGQAFQFIKIPSSQVLTIEFDDVNGCCTYGDVNKLKEYGSGQYLQLNNAYLQSYKYFHQYRQDVLKLLTFTDEDIRATDTIANGTFKNDKSHKICLHTRRSDFIGPNSYQESTEKFTIGSALYVDQKFRDQGKNATIALLGDDRAWLNSLIKDEPWAVVPPMTNRPTTDYAFFARHCQTIILTAPASTFGIWSAYLSSAEKVYFNIDFTKNDAFKAQFTINDYFPMEWIPLSQNKKTGVISELLRSFNESNKVY